ncbi:MAG: FkbM family methyltransferase [Enhydrobacter sp.]|nr:MAG: FkbM family methyltransferase [Enhydrobacter sp.]
MALVAKGLGAARFTLLDVGCSGGIDARWRTFGRHLRALAIDASEAECRRLRGLEQHPDIEYLAAFVAGSADSRIDLERGQASPLIMRMRDRLSFMRTREIREARLSQAAIEEKLRHNAWELTRLADHTRPLAVPDLLAARAWTDVDYLKIDIDGSDFEVLQSLDGRFEALGVLGVQLEVNFVGTDAATEHAFHNTDRFMRRQGYDLFRLDVRTYSSRALPARYVWPTPAETVSGRPWQGEAYYARDVGTALDAGKTAKLAAVFSAWNVPDVAAELLHANRTLLAPLFDVDIGLDLLAAQIQPDGARKLDYRAYMKAFEADDPSFYRREGNIGLGERLQAAWRAFRRPRP